jgi:hypothetical protein
MVMANGKEWRTEKRGMERRGEHQTSPLKVI